MRRESDEDGSKVERTGCPSLVLRINAGRDTKMKDTVDQDIMRIGEDILSSDRFAKAELLPHHNKHCTIASHSFETARHALSIQRWLDRHGVKVSKEDVVRSSLLHDIGMTEDPVFLSPSYRKAYSHPREGSRIAIEEFDASAIQADAISRHMWPIGFIPPRSATGWIVVAADKCSSVCEVQRELRSIVRKTYRMISSHA